MITNPIYLDHAATTPIHPSVVEAMLPYLSDHFGNPSSMHSYGRTSKDALNRARDQIAGSLHCKPGQLVFTSGGTESDNMAIIGASASLKGRKHIITSQAEHHAVLNVCQHLETIGYEVTYLPVDSYGQVSVDNVRAAIRAETGLISIMFGNNEVGTLQPIHEIGQLAQEAAIFFHVDGVQVFGKLPIDLSTLPVDMMSFSAHKMNGPKGIGALYIAGKVSIQPYMLGGAQERKRRAGTENVAGIVGFAEAVRISHDNLAGKQQRLEQLRHVMAATLEAELGEGGFVMNGHPSERLPHILNISFPAVSTETMLMNLDLAGIAAASGSACSSGSLEGSHVLHAMNVPSDIADSAVRFSFGLGNTEEAVRDAAIRTAKITKRLRNNMG